MVFVLQKTSLTSFNPVQTSQMAENSSFLEENNGIQPGQIVSLDKPSF